MKEYPQLPEEVYPQIGFCPIIQGKEETTSKITKKQKDQKENIPIDNNVHVKPQENRRAKVSLIKEHY